MAGFIFLFWSCLVTNGTGDKSSTRQKCCRLFRKDKFPVTKTADKKKKSRNLFRFVQKLISWPRCVQFSLSRPLCGIVFRAWWMMPSTFLRYLSSLVCSPRLSLKTQGFVESFFKQEAQMARFSIARSFVGFERVVVLFRTQTASTRETFYWPWIWRQSYLEVQRETCKPEQNSQQDGWNIFLYIHVLSLFLILGIALWTVHLGIEENSNST